MPFLYHIPIEECNIEVGPSEEAGVSLSQERNDIPSNTNGTNNNTGFTVGSLNWSFEPIVNSYTTYGTSTGSYINVDIPITAQVAAKKVTIGFFIRHKLKENSHCINVNRKLVFHGASRVNTPNVTTITLSGGQKMKVTTLYSHHLVEVYSNELTTLFSGYLNWTKQGVWIKALVDESYLVNGLSRLGRIKADIFRQLKEQDLCPIVYKLERIQYQDVSVRQTVSDILSRYRVGTV